MAAWEGDSDKELVRIAATELAKRFDSVHIFVTRESPRDEETVEIAAGEGNFLAVYGQIVRWLKREDARLARDEDDE